MKRVGKLCLIIIVAFSFCCVVSADGKYEVASDASVVVQDDYLVEGGSTCYKAKLVDNRQFSDVIRATTLNADTNIDHSSSEDLTNPKTGSFYVYFVMVCLMISFVSFFLMVSFNRSERNNIV